MYLEHFKNNNTLTKDLNTDIICCDDSSDESENSKGIETLGQEGISDSVCQKVKRSNQYNYTLVQYIDISCSAPFHSEPLGHKNTSELNNTSVNTNNLKIPSLKHTEFFESILYGLTSDTDDIITNCAIKPSLCTVSMDASVPKFYHE